MLYNLTYITKSDRKSQCLKIVKRLVKHIADSLKCFIFASVSNFICKDLPYQSFIDCYTSVYKTLSAVRSTGLFNPLNYLFMALPNVIAVNQFYSVQRFDLNGFKVVCFCPSLSEASEVADYFNKDSNVDEFFVCPIPYLVVRLSKSNRED